MCDSTKQAGDDRGGRRPLLPDRYPQGDFFVCDIFDAAPKGDMASMEHPIFSLSTKPDTRVREYEHNGIRIAIKPSVDGLATVHDRDILIYCISQLMSALNDGRELSQMVRFRAYDMLVATNRNTAGTGYAQLKAALERLAGMRISTNIVTGGQETFRTFGLIESAEVVRETRDGRMQEIEVKLSDWVFNAIRSKEVLTLHRDYFRLRKPLERRIYELARKHCGQQKTWRIGLGPLQKKCGSASSAREFRRMVKAIADQDTAHDHMPDYAVRLEEDMVIVISKGTSPAISLLVESAMELVPETYAKAREAAPGWDIYVLEQEWREWITETPQRPDAAFLGFCRKIFEKRGRP